MRDKFSPAYRVGDDPQCREALDKARQAIDEARKYFFYAIDGVLYTEREYESWRDNGGRSGSR